jgi:hypothetical protein
MGGQITPQDDTTPTSHSLASPDCFSPSIQDLIATRDVLRFLCPLELVYTILDFAGYWVPITSVCTKLRHVCPRDNWRNGATLCYLVTAPILGQPHDTDPEDIRLKVVCVKFVTVSHDPREWNEEIRGTAFVDPHVFIIQLTRLLVRHVHEPLLV